jgi:hypothetical protein
MYKSSTKVGSHDRECNERVFRDRLKPQVGCTSKELQPKPSVAIGDL